MASGLGGMVAQGMAFGAGSAIAHRAIGAAADAVSGGGSDDTSSHQQEQGSYAASGQSNERGPCDDNQSQLYQCLSDQSGNAAACQFFFDALRDCQDNLRYAQPHQ